MCRRVDNLRDNSERILMECCCLTPRRRDRNVASASERFGRRTTHLRSPTASPDTSWPYPLTLPAEQEEKGQTRHFVIIHRSHKTQGEEGGRRTERTVHMERERWRRTFYPDRFSLLSMRAATPPGLRPLHISVCRGSSSSRVRAATL